MRDFPRYNSLWWTIFSWMHVRIIVVCRHTGLSSVSLSEGRFECDNMKEEVGSFSHPCPGWIVWTPGDVYIMNHRHISPCWSYDDDDDDDQDDCVRYTYHFRDVAQQSRGNHDLPLWSCVRASFSNVKHARRWRNFVISLFRWTTFLWPLDLRLNAAL